MKNKHCAFHLLALCGGLLLLPSCASDKEVTSYFDNFSGRTDLMSGNLLEAPGQPREVVWLNAARIFKQANVGTYLLEASYMSTAEAGLLEIGPGQTLTLMADADTLKFSSASGSTNNRRKLNKGAIVRETAIYTTTKEQIQKIAGAKSVKVQMRGANGVVERDFGAENFERFRAFVAKYAL